MKKQTKQVEKIILTEVDRLDPITVIIDDIAVGIGSITICCYGKSWTSYWGSMGDQRIVAFVTTCNVQYLADKLSNTPANEVDYETISDKIGACVDVTTALTYSDELTAAYGPDWYQDLPTCPNPDYQYLCRIIRAVLEGLAPASEGQKQ